MVLKPTNPIFSMIYESNLSMHFNQFAKNLTRYEISSAQSSGIFIGILFIVVKSLFKKTGLVNLLCEI